MAVNIQKLFNVDLPNGIQKHQRAATEIGATYQINIDGDDGGEWYIDCSSNAPTATSGNPGSADCTISISSDDFQKIHENPDAHGMQLFFAGKLKVQGNQMLATKLKKLFALKP